jgi:hypothetical protein
MVSGSFAVMAIISRDPIQVVYDSSISPGVDVQSSPVIPNGEKWEITRVIFADKAINDGMSGGFQLDFGSGGSREIIFAAYLLGQTQCLEINKIFVGDGSAVFRYIRENNAAVAKKMFVMVEGFKRIGDID